MAISLERPRARASSRFARFAQAISSTKAAAPARAHTIRNRMSSTPAEVRLRIAPQGRFDTVDVRARLDEEAQGALEGRRKALYTSFHTTAGYLDRGLAAPLAHHLLEELLAAAAIVRRARRVVMPVGTVSPRPGVGLGVFDQCVPIIHWCHSSNTTLAASAHLRASAYYRRPHLQSMLNLG